jgi:hypothetical protein
VTDESMKPPSVPPLWRRGMRRVRRVQTRRWGQSRPDLVASIENVRQRKLTYVSTAGLLDLAWAAQDLDRRGLQGDIIEAGTALGGSAVVLVLSKDNGRVLRAYDTFGLIPEPTSLDGRDVQNRYKTIIEGKAEGIGGDTYYGYRDDLLGTVTATLESFGIDMAKDRVELVQGRFEDTLHVTDAVALAHIDADWYESVATCLREIHPKLVPGGRFVIDDYDSWSGARRAVDDFLSTKAGDEYRKEGRSRLHLVRRS